MVKFTNKLLNVETVDCLADEVCDSVRIGTSCRRLSHEFKYNLNEIKLF